MTPLWNTDPSILYEKNYLFEIVPLDHFDFNRKLNAMLRLSISYSLILYLMGKKDNTTMYIPIVVAALTYVIGMYYTESYVNMVTNDLKNDVVKGNSEINITNENNPEKDPSKPDELDELIKELNGECRIPTKHNPFMNPLPHMKSEEMGKESCASYNNKGIQRNVDKKFNTDLYRDVNDIFGKNNSQRQFFSVPGKSIPNDQGEFAKWLYATPPTCKEGNGVQCDANQHKGWGIRGGGPGNPTA